MKTNDMRDALILADAELTVTRREIDEAIQDIRRAEKRHLNGEPWVAALDTGDGRSVVGKVTALQVRLSGVSGQLTRTAVAQLRDDGVSIPKIAKVFGVSHQRISNVLRRIEQMARRAA